MLLFSSDSNSLLLFALLAVCACRPRTAGLQMKVRMNAAPQLLVLVLISCLHRFPKGRSS